MIFSLNSVPPKAGLLAVASLLIPTQIAWVERSAFVMGTTLRVTAQAPTRERGIAAAESAFAAVRRTDLLLSSWRDDSEIARLHRAAPGTSVALSRGLLDLLLEARRWTVRTGGAFDPAIGALIDAWDLRGAGRLPEPRSLGVALARTGFAGFVLDSAAGTAVRLSPAWIDAGGFGKGAALRAAGAALRAAGVTAALLDFGGQVLVLGPPGGAAREVGVAHPAHRHRRAAVLCVAGRSVATTAQSERYVEVGGIRYGHVLDPRTGHPVPPWGSVSVVAGDPLEADVLSTALFVLGPEAGLHWASQEGIAALFLVERGGALQVQPTPALEPYLRHAGCSPGST